ncbi:MAG: hypothetical protein IPJ65_15125 [Archangiaceae bacterium]|nr:hypothetical protein [Archangiaceae bacterium]
MSPCRSLRVRRFPGPAQPVELFLTGDGRVLETAPPGEVQKLALPATAFAFSGLVDLHAHTCWPHPPNQTIDFARWMRERRAEYAANAVTLVREMGGAHDSAASQPEVPGLPSVQACGTLLAPHAYFPFPATTDENLLPRAVASIERGAKWVKVFADWSHDFGGREDTAFSETDPVSYAPEPFAQLVAEVHRRGARVAAHAFTPGGCRSAIAAGCDSLEHGWGLEEADLEQLRARGIAWVPLLGIAGEMHASAVAHGGAERAMWISRSLAKLRVLLPRAEQLGVQVLAGTDWHPQVLVSDELDELTDAGLSRAAAFAAGTTAARAFLGVPERSESSLVVVSDDPRERPEVLQTPLLVVVNGRVVDTSRPPRRPRHVLSRLRIG